MNSEEGRQGPLGDFGMVGNRKGGEPSRALHSQRRPQPLDVGSHDTSLSTRNGKARCPHRDMV
jgi:hypothetical protein